MTDYKALVVEARATVAEDYRDFPIASQGYRRRIALLRLADAVEALVAAREESERQYQEAVDRNLATLDERDEAVKQLAESRARFGDSEARRVELEAVIAEIRMALAAYPNYGARYAVERVIAAVPSTVLGEHDQEVAARALEDAAADLHDWAALHAGPEGAYTTRIGANRLRNRAAAIRAGKP